MKHPSPLPAGRLILHLILGLALGLLPPLFARASLPADASKPGYPRWLPGTWALCEDPDGDPRDYLRFNADGSGTGFDARGEHRFPFRFQFEGPRTRVVVQARGIAGRGVRIVFDVAPDRDRLTVANYGPQHASVYVRRQDADGLRCSVRA